jgi:ribosomal protein S12 methylthiotransferase accessory factor
MLERLLAHPFWAQLADELALDFSQAAVALGLAVLLQHRVATLAPSGSEDETSAAFWSIEGRKPGAARIEVCAAGIELPVDVAGLASVSTETSDAEKLRVITTDDYLRSEIGAKCSDSVPTLLVRPTGRRFWIGPLLNLPGSICYECLRFVFGLHRWRQAEAATPAPDWYPGAPAIAALPSSLTLAAAMVATVVERFSAGDELTELRDGITLIDPWNWNVERVPFRSRDDCPRCGAAHGAFTERQIGILGHPLSGIVESVRVEPVAKGGPYVALGKVLIPNWVREARGAAPPISAGGKGSSAELAGRILTLEAAERYSAEFDGTETLVAGTTDQMAAFNIADLFQFSEAQYAASQSNGDPPFVPARLKSDVHIHWAVARSLGSGTQVALPAACVYLDYAFNDEPLYYVSDTSGCAAAISMDTAIRHALLELVERDALAIWWYNRIPRSIISFTNREPTVIRHARRALERKGRSLHLFDLTHDIGVPVVAATSADEEGKAIYLGAAADLCPRRAAERAAMELLQFWFWDYTNERVARSRRAWIGTGSYDTDPFLDPRRAPGAFRLEVRGPNQQDLQCLIGMLSKQGLQPYLVDLTRPALGVPVARAVIPTLRHYGRRLAPGRLYDVPVQMGWLPRATPEAHCNPHTVPL